ncbi:PiggyBac transposable element-derived protein 3 [Elysia marginata]|uniref:PiggyBac transposable element-derived protein 3 n=1 Tax=Elysia marginata TaxID=1093978 RepID=A0AAV4JCQ6_9GAST|nr:PiggyBac transposable element-derived protein 3 [Elysia marginata]
MVRPYDVKTSKKLKTGLKLGVAQQSVPKPITPTPTKRQKVAVDVRHSGVGHHLESMPKQRRCSHCGKKANLICKACNVPLHKKCNAEFHV